MLPPASPLLLLVLPLLPSAPQLLLLVLSLLPPLPPLLPLASPLLPLVLTVLLGGMLQPLSALPQALAGFWVSLLLLLLQVQKPASCSSVCCSSRTSTRWNSMPGLRLRACMCVSMEQKQQAG
jgi:hypothetical protein